MKTFSKILSIVLALSLVLGFALVGTAAEESVVLNFATLTTANTTTYTTTTILPVLKSAASDNTIITSVTKCEKIYPGNSGTTGNFTGAGFLKTGTGSANGELTITLAKTITKVDMVCHTWTTSSSDTVTVNGSTKTAPKTGSWGTLSFDITDSNTLTLSFGKRVFIQSITLYYAGEGGSGSDTPPCEHDNATYTKALTTHTMDCPDCDETFPALDHTYSNKVCSTCGYELYTPANMDKVTIYYPADDTYISGTASGSKLAAGNALELVVVLESGQYKFVTAEGKYLTAGATGNSLSLTTTATNYSLWTLEECASGWYIKNVNAVYQSNAQYIEYYGGFTTYKLGSGGAIYTYLFEKTGVATEVPEFQCNHADANGDYKCDLNCGEILAPEADETLTLEDANTLGVAHASNAYTQNKYYVTGVITEVTKADYGNLVITDSEGNTLVIYGSYSQDGSDRYDAMAEKPGVGDEVTLYGIIGQYGGTAQMKNGWIDDFVKHTCVDSDDDHACDVCDDVLSDCADDDDDHACDVCGDVLSDCADDDDDHACDVCGDVLSDCADDDDDHACDVCGDVLSECADDDDDHKCDVCDATLSQCADDDDDHKCDVCDATLSQCADDDGDEKCDVCDADLSTGNADDNQNNDNTNNDQTGDEEEDEEDEPAKTGDVSLISAVILTALSASGMGLVIKKKVF